MGNLESAVHSPDAIKNWLLKHKIAIKKNCAQLCVEIRTLVST